MRNESENPIFHLHFLNKDSSVTNTDKCLKFSGIVLCVCLKGSLSQIFYLGPSFYFMLCRKKCFEIFRKKKMF